MNKTKTLIRLLYACCISILGHAQAIKPYTDIITPKAMTQKGYITTHVVDNKLYFEIPETILNTDMLFVYGRDNTRHIQWQKLDQSLQLMIPPIVSKAGNIIPVIKSTPRKRKDCKAPIMAGNFPILAQGAKGRTYLIDVTSLFLSPPKGLPGSGKPVVDGFGVIDKVIAVDHTIEVQITKTIGSDDGAIPVVNYFSMVLLPEPMMPRLWDHRMGFGKEEPGNIAIGSKSSVRRWWLEKKYPDHRLSDPVRPIILYYDPAMPDKWKPYIKSGVEQWLPAFEAAGFTNAIQVKELPEADTNYSPYSTRYSMIRWFDNTEYRGKEDGGGASVSKVIDQRTGEIIKADIDLGAPYQFLSDQYFVRCSPLDKRAQRYPFPDTLMGELIAFITAHETGHVFGLLDGNYGEYVYPFKKLRDKKWLQTMGHTPSIMNYTRHNFLPQPEDSIPPALLQQHLGPTDLYSIRWGYTPFDDAKSPDEELPYLEAIVKEQDSIPWYRFLHNTTTYIGPQTTNEVVASDDPVKATALGIENLKRVIELIPLATKNERGYAVKQRLHQKTMNLWVAQMKLVVSLIGGYTIQHKSAGQKGPTHTPIPAKRQKEAIAFLNKAAFHPPLWMVPENLIKRYEGYASSGSSLNNSIHIITRRQIKILRELLSPPRLRQLEETTLTTKGAYTTAMLFGDLNTGLWQELTAKDLRIDPYRQEIQLAYITILKEGINTEGRTFNVISVASNKYLYSNYTRGALLRALQDVKENINHSLKKVKNPATRSHLELCLKEIHDM